MKLRTRRVLSTSLATALLAGLLAIDVVAAQAAPTLEENLPPTAIFTEMRAYSYSGGLINLDPGLSYDVDPSDPIRRWSVDLIDLDGNTVPVDSGSGAPPRAVPMHLPVDHRSGFLYAHLRVFDTWTSSDAYEVIGFNQCIAATTRVPVPAAVLKAGSEAPLTGPVPQLVVTDGRSSAQVFIGTSPFRVTLSDYSFHRTGDVLTQRVLTDESSNGEMYGTDGPLVISSPTPIEKTLTFVNPLSVPQTVVFRLAVKDSARNVGAQTVEIVVKPANPAVLDVAMTQNPTNPQAIDVTPSASGVPVDLPWTIATTGLGSSDAFRAFDAKTPLAKQTVVVPRSAGVAMRANLRFQYGGADLDDSLLYGQDVCRDVDLPVLTPTQANKPPDVTVTPMVQHATGTARLEINVHDPDPAALGDLAASFGFSPTELVGILDVRVNGLDAAELGAVYVRGPDRLKLNVEVPATTTGRQDIVIVARDFFGGTTTTTATVYFDPPNQPINSAQLTLQHAPNPVPRGQTATETVSLATPNFAQVVLLALDVPSDATFIDATTSGVDAITNASILVPRWMCSRYNDPDKTRLLCSFLNVTPPTVPFVYPALAVHFSSTSAKSQFSINAGLLQSSPTAVQQDLASLRDSSVDALRIHRNDVVALSGFTANAGPDQTIDAVTIGQGGVRSPTRVTLDGSLSSNDGRPQTYRWRQTSGPAVAWNSPTTGTGENLRATGQQATFSAPTITATTTLQFELSVSVPGVSPKTDTVAITLNPPSNQLPVVTGLTTTPDTSAATPPVRTVVAMVATGSDPDGGSVSFSWRAWQGAGDKGTAVATTAGGSNARLVWPVGVRQLSVEVTVTDARGGKGIRKFVLGVPLAKITISVGGTVGGTAIGNTTPTAAPLAPVSLVASMNRPPTGAISWSLLSGPPIPGVTFPRTGSTFNFTAPVVATAGQQLVLRATVVDETGSATFDTTIALQPTPPPSVSLVVWPGNGAPPGPGSGLLDFLQPVLVPPGGLLSASSVATGTAPFTYQWSASPALVFSTPTTSSTTMIAPATDQFVTVKVRVTDATGASAEATRLVQVGAGLPTVDLTCAGGTVMNDLIRQARANATGGALLDVTVPLGVPPLGTVNLGPIAFTGDCTTSPSIAFPTASFTLFNGFFGGSGLSGTVTTDRICITGGQVTVPPELGLGPTAAGTAANPLCLSLNPSDWVGADPALPTPPPPSPSDPPRGAPSPTPPDPNLFRLPTITCPPGAAPISGSINWPGVFPGISLGGVVPQQTTARFNCGFIELTSTASAPWGDLALRGLARRDGSFAAAVVTKGLRLFGTSSNTDLTGTFSRAADGTIVWQVGADITAPSLGTGAITVPTIHVALGTSGFSFGATADLHFGGGGPNVSGALAGTITGQDEFTASLTASLASPWAPLPGLNISNGSIVASIARAAGATTFDVALVVNGDWQPPGVSALTVRQLTARLTNRGAPPECGITAGSTWAELTGAARVDVGAPVPVVDLSVRACIGIQQPSVVITSTANLNSWKPIASVDFTFSSVGLVISKPANGEWTIDIVGTANYAGINLAGRARFAPLTGSFVLDAAGDLSGLHLGPLASGHVVFSSVQSNGYVPVALPSDPPSGVAPIDLLPGITAFADVNLDAGIRTALDKVLNPPAPKPKIVPIPESIRFAATLGGASIRLKGSISFPPGQGLTLFATCPDEAPKVGGNCVLTHKLTTSLQFTTLFISLDTTGRFGFGGEADLRLASSDGVAPASLLHVVAEASIDITGPAINLALYFIGDWNNALGIDGLVLRDLAIQGGVSFASYPPVPTVGFGATVVRLPDALSHMLGIQTDKDELMRLVVNIAPTKPILEFTLGVADGHDFLKPVQPISAANADALTIDYASLVFAPLGGDVGPYHYEPGISVGFAGSAFGVDASGLARITLVPPNLHADLDVGDIVVGSGAAGVHIKAAHFLLDVSLTGVVLELSGGLAITNGPDAGVKFHLNATTVPPAAAAAFTLDITNWNLPFPGASVRELHANAAISASIGALPSGALSINGVLRVGTTNVNATGSITLANGVVTAMSMQGSVSSFSLGGVNIGGPGCDGTGPQTGACISAALDPTKNPPLSLGVAGMIGVAGYSADLSASVGPTGLHGTGTLRVATLGNPSITGDLWFGSGLAGVTARDGQGVIRTVHAGDFRFTATATTPGGLLAGSTLDLDLGSIGGVSWIKGGGTLALAQRSLANATIRLSTTGFSADGTISIPAPGTGGSALALHLGGSVTFPTSFLGLGFSLTGSLDSQPSGADPAVRAMGPGTFTLSKAALSQVATFSFSGSVSLPGMSGSLTGSISTNLNYCLTGTFSFSSPLSVNGSAYVGNNCDTPGLHIHLSKSGFTFDGRVKTTGTSLTASYNDDREMAVTPAHPYAPPIDNTTVRDWVELITKVNGTLAWSNSGGFSLSSSFSGSARGIWNVRRSRNNVYADRFDATVDVSVSGSQLCATFGSIGHFCIG